MKQLKLMPLGDRVIVEGADESTASGIVIPDTAHEKPKKGTVIAVGPGKVSANGNVIPMTVAVGDQVLFKEYSPEEVKIDDKEYLIIREEDILAIVK